MRFDVVAPYVIGRFTPKKLLTKDSIKKAKEDLPDLVSACGCYVFAVRAGKGYTPYYVGQANKSALVGESLNASNINKYNQVLANTAGTPVMFYLPLVTANGKLSKPTVKADGRASIKFLEEWLIATALQKNPNLVNEKKTAFLRNLYVTGIFNAQHGKSTNASKDLKKSLGL